MIRIADMMEKSEMDDPALADALKKPADGLEYEKILVFKTILSEEKK